MKRCKKLIFILAVLLPVISGYAGVSLVMNGSFEADGYIGYVSSTNHPYWWDEVEKSDNYNFVCSVDDYRSIDGQYSLVLTAQSFNLYKAGQYAKVSQKVYLEDVNTVSFYLRLTGEDGWDSSQVTAFVAIDGNDIWESAEPFDWWLYESVLVPDYYKDANSHTFTLGMRSDVSEVFWNSYEAHWDVIRFDTHCGIGHHPWDINLDCNVDMYDVYAMAESWLVDTTEVICRADVYEDELRTVNFMDMADVEDHFGLTSNTRYPDFSWPEIFIHDFDFNFDGIVDMSDIKIVIEKIASDWLATGSYLETDYNQDKIVDFKDYAFAVGELGARDSLYGW